mgnify:FL=1
MEYLLGEVIMEKFLSTYHNKIDAKGRVSVPAQFRSVISCDSFDKLFCYPSLDAKAIDSGGEKLANQISDLLDKLDPYSDERDHLSTALFGLSEMIKIDTDGRVILSSSLREHANIDSEVVFVGLGEKFQIWEPNNFKAHLLEARERVKKQRNLLRVNNKKIIEGVLK